MGAYKRSARERSLAILAIFALSASSFAGESGTRRKALDWLGGAKVRENWLVQKLTSQLAQDEQIRSQSEAAVTLAISEKNAQAEAIARDALSQAERSRNLAKSDLDFHKKALRTVDIALNHLWTDDDAMMIPLEWEKRDPRHPETSGKVELMRDMHPIHAGETLTVGPHGVMRLLGPDGHLIHVGSGSRFIVGKPTSDADGGDTTEVRLLKGLIHIKRILSDNPNERLHRTRLAAGHTIIGTRGTEFDLSIGEDGRGHLVPFSGEVDLSAQQEGSTAAWKLDPSMGKYQAPADAARVAAIEGDARHVDSAGAAKPATAGAPLTIGDQLTTGASGAVLLDLIDGQRVALAESSTLSFGKNPKTGEVLYILKAGRARFSGPGKAVHSLVLTPNAVVTPEALQFDVALGAGNAADFSIAAGTISITAVEDRLDRSKLDTWWEK